MIPLLWASIRRQAIAPTAVQTWPGTCGNGAIFRALHSPTLVAMSAVSPRNRGSCEAARGTGTRRSRSDAPPVSPALPPTAAPTPAFAAPGARRKLAPDRPGARGSMDLRSRGSTGPRPLAVIGHRTPVATRSSRPRPEPWRGTEAVLPVRAWRHRLRGRPVGAYLRKPCEFETLVESLDQVPGACP